MATRARPAPQIDEHYATEIRLYLDNDYDLDQQKVKSFLPNIARKMISGKYDASKAWKLWMYLVDEAVRKYDVQHVSGGKHTSRGPWGGSVAVGSLSIVDKPTREAVARELAEYEHRALLGGEYGDLYEVAGRKKPAAKANPRKPAFRIGDIVRDGYGTYKVVILLSGNKYEVVAHPATSQYPSVLIKAGKDITRVNRGRSGARQNGSTFTATVYGPSGSKITSSSGYGSELTASEWGRLTKQQYGAGYTYKVTRSRAARKNGGSRRNTGKPSSVTVRANLWQDSYGNIYHVAYVDVNGRHALTTPTTYGYGSHYEYTAYEALANKGLVRPLKHYSNGGTEVPRIALQDQGIAYSHSSTRVSRKKDL